MLAVRFGMWLCAGALLAALTARAAASSARLVYERGDGTEGCPDEQFLRRAVSLRLGYDPFDGAAESRIVAVVSRDGERLKGRVELIDGAGRRSGRREFSESVARCSSLLYAMALSVSIALDRERAFEGSAGAEPDSARPEPSPVAVPRARAEKPVRREITVGAGQDRSVDRDRRTSDPTPSRAGARAAYWVGGSGHVSAGLAPSAAVGGSLLAFGRLGDWSLTVLGRADAPVGQDLDSGGSVRTWLVAGGVVPCGHLEPLMICGQALLGRLAASAGGVSQPRSDAGFFAALGGRLAVLVPVDSGVVVFPHLDLQANLTRVTIELDGQQVSRVPRASGALGLAGMVRLP